MKGIQVSSLGTIVPLLVGGKEMMRLSLKIEEDNLLPQVVLMPSRIGTLLISLSAIQRVFPVNPFEGHWVFRH